MINSCTLVDGVVFVVPGPAKSVAAVVKESAAIPIISFCDNNVSIKDQDRDYDYLLADEGME